MPMDTTREELAELQLLFKSMVNAFVVFDSVFDDAGTFVSYRFVYINDAYERVTGVKNEEVKGKTVHEVWPKTEPEWIRIYGEVAVTGVSQEFELYHGPTKKLYHCSAYRPWTKKDRFCVAFEDITERRKAEEDLRQAEEKFRLLIDNSHDIIYTLNLEGVFTFVSPAWTALLGHEITQVVGKPFQRFIHPDDVGRCEAFLQGMLEQGQPQSGIEYRVQHADGSWRWHVSNAVSLKDETGRVVGGEGIAMDITERKKTEEALRESKALVEAIVENVPLMIFLKEATDLRFVLFNRAGEELLGYNRKDMIGKSDLDFFPPDQAAHFIAKDRQVLAGEEVILDIPEEPIQTANKGRRLLHTRKVCIRGADGATKFLLGISEDITERKKMEDELKKEVETLQKFTKMTVGRELKMMALKQEIARLKKELGEQ